MLQVYGSVFESCFAAVSDTSSEPKPALLAVLSEAAYLNAEALHEQISPSRSHSDITSALVSLADQMLQLVMRYGTCFCIVNATEKVISWAKGHCQELLSIIKLEVGQILILFLRFLKSSHFL